MGARVRAQGLSWLFQGLSWLFQGPSRLFQGPSWLFQGPGWLFQGTPCGCGQCCPLGCLCPYLRCRASLDNFTHHSPHSPCSLITAWNVTAHQVLKERRTGWPHRAGKVLDRSSTEAGILAPIYLSSGKACSSSIFILFSQGPEPRVSGMRAK